MAIPGPLSLTRSSKPWQSTLEVELRSLQHLANRAPARAAAVAWIEDCNTRRHSARQTLPPAAYEQLLAERGKKAARP